MTDAAGADPTWRAARSSLTRLTAATATAGLLWLTLWIALAPPEQAVGSWTPVALAMLVLAIVASVPLASSKVPLAHVWPWLCAAGALAVLVWTKENRDLQGWWLTIELAAYVALVAGMSLFAFVAEVAAAAAVVGTVAGVSLAGTTTASLFGNPLAGFSAVSRTIVVAAILITVTRLLRRAARRTDVLLRDTAGRRTELAAASQVGERRTQVRRFLHDSGLNNLEAVARGVSDDHHESMRSRCAADAERWLDFTEPTPSATTQAFAAGIQNARMLGVDVTATFEGGGELPPPVLDRLAGAAAEALRNAAKYAGSDQVRLAVTTSAEAALVEVSDGGRGFDPAATAAGMGLSLSIRRRLAEVGGDAEVISAPGEGTVVRLRWPGAATPIGTGAMPADDAPLLDLPGELARLSWAPIALVAVASLVGAAADLTSVALPWLIAVIGLVVCAACGWLVHRWRSNRLNRVDLAWLLAALAAATLATPIADPFCSAVTASPLIPDGRLLLLALVGVLLVSRAVSLLAVGVALGSLALAAAMWQVLWPPCAAVTIPTAIVLVLLSWGAWFFGGAVLDQQAAARASFEDDLRVRVALARTRADALVRAQWRIPAVVEARELLRAIGDGSAPLDDPLTRAIATDRAARLRSAVQISELPDAVGQQIAAIIDAGRQHRFPVRVSGNPGDVLEPTADASSVAGKLSEWRTGIPASQVAEVTVTCSRAGAERSMLVWARCRDGVAVQDREDQRCSAEAEVTQWADEDGWWWLAEWADGDRSDSAT